MTLDEFDVIRTYFKKKLKRNDILRGIGDDCALLSPPANKNLLVSTDTLNLGSHFFADTPPFDIGYKSVAVSLSDLAAMGGEPAWLLLSLTLPKIDNAWLEEFSKGLFSAMCPLNLELVGGNITKGPLAITTQILGFIPEGIILSRSGARENDLIFVTGTLGDAALALAIFNKEIDERLFSVEEIQQLKTRLFRPLPRIMEGQIISEVATSAIDLSDGLIADLQHILEQSRMGATLYLKNIPLSPQLKKIERTCQQNLVLNGGDDYELCFTLPPKQVPALMKKLVQQNLGEIRCIGKIESTLGLRITQANGLLVDFEHKGYKHF
jgi:thiamine-monophosphate kinase